MRPEILNPLFAEVEALKGIGPGLKKPLERLGLARAVDIAFHLPTGWIDRKRVERLDIADAGQVITIALTASDYRQSGGRGPFRVHATDVGGDYVSLVYFGGNPGWARKLFPLGEQRIVSGKLESYGQELQIVHPDLVLAPGEEPPAAREPV
jgi:ATP-dependent DNA helicase RecG